MKKDAIISSCEQYRYCLSRVWKPELGVVNFIGLNPSTADANKDDPTIQKCVRYAKAWGYGGIVMTNLFAFRSPHPDEMKKAGDPIGSENDKYLRETLKEADISIAVWGDGGQFLDRGNEVLKTIPDPHCLKMSASGQPRHVRFLKKHLKPIPILNKHKDIKGDNKPKKHDGVHPNDNQRDVTPERHEWTDIEKHNVRQYERMQDILTTYSTMAIKTLTIISGGALVSIGAAFMSFLSLENTDREAVIFMKSALAEGFSFFAYALCLILVGLVATYFGRAAYLIACDEYSYTKKVRWHHEIYGLGFEGIAIIIFLCAAFMTVQGIFTLNDNFMNFPT